MQSKAHKLLLKLLENYEKDGKPLDFPLNFVLFFVKFYKTNKDKFKEHVQQI